MFTFVERIGASGPDFVDVKEAGIVLSFHRCAAREGVDTVVTDGVVLHL